MWLMAIKMLVGDTGKYVGMLFGVTFAAFLMTQQGAIFWGLMTRSFGFVDDTNQADVWVMDPEVRFVDDNKPLASTELSRVRGVAGVEWAVPLFKRLLVARLDNGSFEQVSVVGIDDTTMIGGPPQMVEGSLADLRRADAVIVDRAGATGRLATIGPDGRRIPVKIGDNLEINDRRAIVVGFCEVSRTFQNQPTIYTTFSRATQFAPRERKLMNFILVKARPGVDPQMLADQIRAQTGLGAYTQSAFKWKTFDFFFKNTGIPINFGMSVLLGFLVGSAIVGQTFYQFTADNIRHFGALKAMGAGNFRLLGMILLQAAIVGVKGYGLGVGAAAFIGWRAGAGGNLAFRMTEYHLLLSAAAVMIIILLSASLSLIKVMRTEPGIVFK
jgi:putative ABC transport system permease protein